MKQEFQKRFQNEFGFAELSKVIVISSILIEMVCRGKKIDSYSEKNTIDNLGYKLTNFKKFLIMVHGSKYP